MPSNCCRSFQAELAQQPETCRSDADLIDVPGPIGWGSGDCIDPALEHVVMLTVCISVAFNTCLEATLTLRALRACSIASIILLVLGRRERLSKVVPMNYWECCDWFTRMLRLVDTLARTASPSHALFSPAKNTMQLSATTFKLVYAHSMTLWGWHTTSRIVLRCLVP